MNRIHLACFGAAAYLCVALSVAPPSPGCRAEEPPAAKENVKELIAQLGSQSFEAREAATRQLMERGEARAALREALKSGDPEVARRAGEILNSLASRERKRAFAAFAGAAKGGTVDEAVERFARREKWDDEEACWKALAGLAAKLTDLEREKFGKVSRSGEDRNSDLALRRFQRGVRLKHAAAPPPAKLWEGRIVLRTEDDLEVRETSGCLLAVCGNIEADTTAHSVIFAGGAVHVHSPINNSLVVCDGDFGAQMIFSSLIIARGNVRCDQFVKDSRIICGGEVQWKHPDWVKDTKVLEKEANPLGFVTFFDPAKAGIKVEAAEGGVRVKGAEKGKPFAAAGLRAGDLITALDGDAVKDADSFRRLLRAKLAVEGTTTVKVRRGDKALDIPVAHKD